MAPPAKKPDPALQGPAATFVDDADPAFDYGGIAHYGPVTGDSGAGLWAQHMGQWLDSEPPATPADAEALAEVAAGGEDAIAVTGQSAAGDGTG